MTKIAVPIRSSSLKDLEEKASSASDYDFLEIWLDKIDPNISAKEIIKACGCGEKKLIITCKADWEKGEWKGTEEERVKRLEEFIKAGVKYIDVGMHTDRYLIWGLGKLRRKVKSGTQIIVSFHDFKETPTEKLLWQIIERGRFLKADIIKLAVKAKTIDDNLVLFRVLRRAERSAVKLIAHCMGEKGRISRIVSPMLGSRIVYAATKKGYITAPGQLLVEDYQALRNIIKL